MKLHRLFYIIVLVLLGLGMSLPEGNEEVRAEVQQLLKEQQPKKALKLLDSYIKNSPEALDLLVIRAEVFIYMTRVTEAESEIENVLKTDQDNKNALLVKSQMRVSKKDYEGAQACIIQGLKLDLAPDMESAFLAVRGRILLKEENYAEAEKVLIEAAFSTNTSIDTYCDLATVLAANNKPDEAIMIIEQSIQRHGLHLRTLIKAGSICNNIGSYDDAISYLDLALTISGEHPVVLATLAEAYLKVGDMSAADRYLSEALGHDHGGLANKIQGDYHMQQDEFLAACKAYNQALVYGYAEEYGEEEIQALIITSCDLD